MLPVVTFSFFLVKEKQLVMWNPTEGMALRCAVVLFNLFLPRIVLRVCF